MKKGLLFTLLVMCIVLTLMTVSAFADGTVPEAGGALSGDYKLAADVTLTAPLSVAAGQTVTIDLNGYSLSYTSGGSDTCSLIDNKGMLTIKDSSDDENGAVIITAGADINKYAYVQAVSNDGTFTLKSGTLKVAAEYACYPVGVRTSAAGAVTTIDGGNILVEKTGSSGTVYGIYGDKIAEIEVNILSGNITVKNSSGATYGIYAKGGYPSNGVVTLSGGSIDVEGTSSVYGVFLQYIGLDMSGTEILVKGTSTAYGVYCSSANENREVSGGSVTVNTAGAAYGLYDYFKSYLKVTGCEVTVSTTGTSNTYPCYYCDISGGSFTGMKLLGCTVTGGSFSFDPVGFYEPYVYEATKDENSGTWTVSPYTGTEAWVKNLNSGKTYASLTVAVKEANVGDTLQLLTDIDLKGYASTIDKGVTIDLNGHKLYSSASLANALLISGGTADNPVTITDKQATSHANAGTIASNQGIWIKGGDALVERINIVAKTTALSKGVTLKDFTGEGAVKLLGVNIEVEGKYAIATDAICAVYVNKTVEIAANDLGADFPFTVSVKNIAASNTGNAYAFFASAGTPNIKINGGTYTISADKGEVAVVGANSNSYYADIYSGCFELTSTTGSTGIGAYNKNAKVYGGYFNIDPSNSLADGCAVVTEGVPDGYSYAVNALDIATVGTTNYNTLQAAIDAALETEDKTVTLIRDAVSNSTVTIGGDVTIVTGEYSLTFNGNPAVKLADGVTMPEAIAALDAFEATAVLSDGSTACYATLDQVLRGSASVKLAKDVSVSSAITLSSSRTIDFNGFDFTSSADQAFELTGYINLATVNVSFTNSAEEKSIITGGIDIVCQNYTFNFTLGKNVEVRDNGPLFMQGNGNAGCITANIYGSLVMDAAESEPEYAAIQGNGQAKYAGTVINIYEGALVDGGQSAGIYHPQDGVLNIYGGTVTGATGIYMKAGTLNISGGSISGKGEKTAYAYNGSGFFTTGDALVVDNCIYPGGTPLVSITGGEFVSDKAEPIGSYKKSDDPAQTDGPDAAVGGFVKGGSFSKSLDVKLLDGSLKYELNSSEGSAPYSYYSTLSGVTEAAEGLENAVIKTTGAAGAGTGETTCTVTFKDDYSGTQYSVTAKAGDKLVLPSLSRSGYVFDGWNDGSDTYEGGSEYEVSGNITLTAQWSKENEDKPIPPLPDIKPDWKPDDKPEEPVFPFDDVSAGVWYYAAVKYVYENGVMNGTDTYKFSPNTTLTRAMVWTMLARLDGVDTNGGATWYEKAREWAMAEGVSDGTDPMGAITREQLVTMLWRFRGEPTVDFLLTAQDADKVSSWAYKAMRWAVSESIIEGDEIGAITPTATATRAHAAAIFMRFCENYELF